jgi:hypothetical protein
MICFPNPNKKCPECKGNHHYLCKVCPRCSYVYADKQGEELKNRKRGLEKINNKEFHAFQKGFWLAAVITNLVYGILLYFWG